LHFVQQFQVSIVALQTTHCIPARSIKIFIGVFVMMLISGLPNLAYPIGGFALFANLVFT